MIAEQKVQNRKTTVVFRFFFLRGSSIPNGAVTSSS